jgi:hypothetical protein
MYFGCHGLTAVIVVIAITGCSPPPQSVSSGATAPPPLVSWDGSYRGTVQITGLGSGIQRQWCETDPQMAVLVTANRFNYAMPHPEHGLHGCDRAGWLLQERHRNRRYDRPSYRNPHDRIDRRLRVRLLVHHGADMSCRHNYTEAAGSIRMHRVLPILATDIVPPWDCRGPASIWRPRV